MNKHEMSEQIYSKYRNWIGEFLSDLMKAVNHGWEVIIFADDEKRRFADYLNWYECTPGILKLIFKEHGPVQIELWEDSVTANGPWNYSLDSSMKGCSIVVKIDPKSSPNFCTEDEENYGYDKRC